VVSWVDGRVSWCYFVDRCLCERLRTIHEVTRNDTKGDGRLNQRLEYTFDDQGNETRLLLKESTTGDKITYKYLEFDAQGNWTKRVMTKGSKVWTNAFLLIQSHGALNTERLPITEARPVQSESSA